MSNKSKIRTAILEAVDTEIDHVPCPEWADGEWDGTVKMRGLSGTERDDFEASCQQLRKSRDERTGKQVREAVPVLTNIRAKLVVKCALDPDDDSRLFTDQDAPALGLKSGKVLDRLYECAARLSGISDADLEDLAKNSGAGTTGDSASPSPESSDAPSPSS